MNSLETSADTGENTGFIILISLVATIGGFLFGFDSGVINGTVEGLQQAFHSNTVGTGFDVASMLLGCAVGAFCAGRLADLFGRRSVLVVAAVCFVVAGWGSGIAATSTEFVIFRLLGGLAVGAASVMAPAYISEVAPARYRGRLTTVQQIAIIVGLFVAFLSNYALARAAGSSLAVLWWGFQSWRWMFWMELIPAVLFFVGLIFIPESPRYLVAKGRDERAMAILTRLYGTLRAHSVRTEIKNSLAGTHRPRLRDLIDAGRHRLRPIVWVGLGLAVLQQFVGINVVFYYGAVLWQAVGFSESDALLINIVSGALSVAACLVALGLIDRVGRKWLLWVGSAGMTVTLALVAIAFSTSFVDASGQVVLPGSMGILALVAANAFVVFFNASWGPVMWVMLGEMFPNRMRGSALAVAGFAQWIANFAVTITFPIFLNGIGLAATYGIYAFMALVSVPFVLKCITETKGKELEQMQG